MYVYIYIYVCMYVKLPFHIILQWGISWDKIIH